MKVYKVTGLEHFHYNYRTRFRLDKTSHKGRKDGLVFFYKDRYTNTLPSTSYDGYITFHSCLWVDANKRVKYQSDII